MFRALCLLLLTVSVLSAQVADLVVKNAAIYTVNEKQPRAKALAVKSGRLIAVADSVDQHVGPSTTVVDANGATIVPGLIDSHVHLGNYGAMLETFDFRKVATPQEIARMVGDAAKTRKPGEWIIGRAWDQTNWGGALPIKEMLDATTPNHPVVLRRVDGHATWVNSAALKIAGINKTTKNPAGGKIVRDEEGEATGILIDTAMGIVNRHVPPASDAQVENRLKIAAEDSVRQGLTSIHDAGIDAQTIAAYQRLIEKGQMPLRIYAMIGGDGPLWQEWLKRGPLVGEQLTIRSLKLYGDGAMGSGGAAFFQPYSDDSSNTGLVINDKARIEKASREAVKAGFQVCTHAIGDKANRNALDAYEAAGAQGKRFRVEHAQVVSLPDFARFRDLGVIASIQATHATSDMRWAEKKLGPDRIAGAYAWQRFLKSGVRIANGSDFPVESNKPLWGFYASVTRQDHQGNPPAGFTPQERLTREQALKSFTLDGAYAAFEEKDKGSLEVGKLADFVMLSKDIMQVGPKEILATEILWTVVGGKTVWKK